MRLDKAILAREAVEVLPLRRAVMAPLALTAVLASCCALRATAAEPLQLTYFQVMAKGLAPALCLELSGLPWRGSHPEDWAAMKPSTPFGQLPILEIPGGPTLAQMQAIVNYVARVAPEAGLHGADDAEFGVSQMLLVFADDDLYRQLGRVQDTVSVKDKVPMSETEAWWSTAVPSHMARLEAIMARLAKGSGRFTASGMTVGEIALFAILHQMKKVDGTFMDHTAGVKAFYERIHADERVQKVLADGGGFPKPLSQYFLPRLPKAAPEAQAEL